MKVAIAIAPLCVSSTVLVGDLKRPMRAQRNNSGKIGRSDGEYSVCEFFDDGSYEYVRRWVGGEEAFEAFKHYTRSVGARIGIVARVIITDGDDCTNMEWQFGKGVAYPTLAYDESKSNPSKLHRR
jgi:hypothetical protein